MECVNPIYLAVCQGFYGASHFLKYQIGSHKWNLNFEMSWVCPLIISSGNLPLIFLEETLLCTLTHHLCYQWWSFNGTSDDITTFITIDTSFTIFGYAGFSHGEWGSMVVCPIVCRHQWSIHFPPVHFVHFQSLVLMELPLALSNLTMQSHYDFTSPRGVQSTYLI